MACSSGDSIARTLGGESNVCVHSLALLPRRLRHWGPGSNRGWYVVGECFQLGLHGDGSTWMGVNVFGERFAVLACVVRWVL